MLQIDDTIVSLELLDDKFICDLQICKGACCLEGDSGAPLEKEEISQIENILPQVWKYLPVMSQETIEEKGLYYIDEDNEYVTQLVDGRECVFACIDQDGIYKCAIEKAFGEGKTTFYKPISCHLYPVRLQKYDQFTAVNVHRWSLCECARKKGDKMRIPVYQFLKEPLVRRFGKEWYEKLEIAGAEFTQRY
ncbi:MAG: DUF3109 family protein [Paludibacteraceae bacterium]